MTDEPKSDTPRGTPEGYTKEEPSVSELGQPGTPGAGMTPQAPHAADADLVQQGDAPADAAGGVLVTSNEPGAAASAHHEATTHDDAHATVSDDGHGHVEPALGPVDWATWGYAVIGAVLGLIVLAFFYVAIA